MKPISVKTLKELGFEGKDGMIPYVHPNPLVRRVFWKRIEVASEMAESGERALDFGCGGGVLTPFVSNKFQMFIGTDYNVNIAENLALKLDLKNFEFQNPFDKFPRYYDTIFALDVLEHVKDLDEILKMFKSILKDDGKLIASVPTENNFYKIGRKFFGHKKPEDHYHNAEYVIDKIQENGFVIEKIVDVPNSLIPLFKIVKAKKL